MTRKSSVVLLSVLYIPPLGILDIVTGADLSLLVLYLVPIAACAWFAGPLEAIGVGTLALAGWMTAQLAFPTHVDLSPAALLAWGSVEKVLVFSALIALVAKQRRLLDSEHSKALTDYVTGLPNRRAFNTALAAAKEGGKPFCLAFMELEGLEDLYLDRGEAFVDSLLKAMASLCRKAVPGFRYSDDRFAALLAGLDGSAAVKRMSDLTDALSEEVLERKEVRLLFKVGIAVCANCGKVSAPQILRFLAGAMINLHGREGDRVEAFPFC
jgi:GGDEF domain-containing protein